MTSLLAFLGRWSASGQGLADKELTAASHIQPIVLLAAESHGDVGLRGRVEQHTAESSSGIENLHAFPAGRVSSAG